jgi:hypothetical protein
MLSTNKKGEDIIGLLKYLKIVSNMQLMLLSYLFLKISKGKDYL